MGRYFIQSTSPLYILLFSGNPALPVVSPVKRPAFILVRPAVKQGITCQLAILHILRVATLVTSAVQH